MTLILRKAEEVEIKRLLDIMYAAFSKDPWNHIMYPEIPGPEARRASIERWRDEISINPAMRSIKAVDSDMDEIIALDRWNVYEAEGLESDWKDIKLRDMDVATNVEAANEFYNATCKTGQKYVDGKPHCCLNSSCAVQNTRVEVLGDCFWARDPNSPMNWGSEPIWKHLLKVTVFTKALALRTWER